MKKVLEIFVLVGIFFCLLISTVFISRCTENKTVPDFGEISGMHVNLRDSGHNHIYSDTWQWQDMQTLSLYNEYILELHFYPGNAFLSPDGIILRYDEYDVEITSLSEGINRPKYALRGLRKCKNSWIEFYTVKPIYSDDGKIICVEIDLYCSIVVNFE